MCLYFGFARFHCKIWFKVLSIGSPRTKINIFCANILLICILCCDAGPSYSFRLEQPPLNLVPGLPFVMRWKLRPLARPNDIPVSNGFVNTIDWDQNHSNLSDLTRGMRRVTGTPWIADFRCWLWQLAIPVADQKDCGLWERDWD